MAIVDVLSTAPCLKCYARSPQVQHSRQGPPPPLPHPSPWGTATVILAPQTTNNRILAEDVINLHTLIIQYPSYTFTTATKAHHNMYMCRWAMFHSQEHLKCGKGSLILGWQAEFQVWLLCLYCALYGMCTLRITFTRTQTMYYISSIRRMLQINGSLW